MPRGPALTRERWTSFVQRDGRVSEESTLRSLVFRGGIEADVRREVWFFLLGYYPFHSTAREREVLQRERRTEYLALKERWQEVLEPDKHDPGKSLELADQLDDEAQFIFVQAKLNALRLEIDEGLAWSNIKTIRKDVPRTDRQTPYYSGDDNVHLQWLHDILVTYSVFHPEVGYAQGMNDVLSMILFVMDNEADAYWCFAKYMETIQADFMAHGMMKKIEQLVELMDFMQPELMSHLRSVDAGDLVYCHRWLLLGFKREFLWDDALKLFEILCSHYLEVNSLEADKARSAVMRAKRERELAASAPELPATPAQAKPAPKPKPQSSPAQAATATAEEPAFTFELFVSAAILQHQQKELMACKDVAEVFALINGLVEKMDLDEVLRQAEQVFFTYCCKSVSAEDAEAYLLK